MLFKRSDLSPSADVASKQKLAGKAVKEDKIYLKYLDQQHNRVGSIEELVSLPGPSCQIRIITQKSFNSFAILRFILKSNKIKECYLTTYNIDKNTIRALREIVNAGDIGKLTILVSSSIKFRMPNRATELNAIAGNGITIIYAWNHTKILLCDSSQFFVVEGSGNLSDNARIEQYLFENNEKTYAFHKRWILDVPNFKTAEIEVIT